MSEDASLEHRHQAARLAQLVHASHLFAEAAPDVDSLLRLIAEYVADGIRQGEAGGSDWRTPPLWGLGRRLWFLHDGRATDLRTAVELHNGEAKASRDRLFERKRDDLQDVLTFLRSL